MPFRGVQLASDDDMLPDSLKGYAPVVRGIARTNAQVVVRQNGYQIYQSYVAPARLRSRICIPPAARAILMSRSSKPMAVSNISPCRTLRCRSPQREGRLKYALTAGQYRSYNRSVEKNPFGQLTGIYGLPHGITLYGGVQGQISTSRRLWGWARTWAISRGCIRRRHSGLVNAGAYRENKRSAVAGQIQRKNFITTGTNFSIAGYRYSTRGYYGDAGRPSVRTETARASRTGDVTVPS